MVSGNSYITAARVVNSGDALSSFRVSGPTDFIGLRLSRSMGVPYTNSFYTEVADTVTCEVYHHDVTATSSGVTDSGSSIAIVEQRIGDLKLTVSGYAWGSDLSGNHTGIPTPRFLSETHPLALATFARGELQYRVRYLL